MNRINALLFVFLASHFLSCKKPEQNSSTSSLTKEETEFCSFSGKRMMLTVAADFPQDAAMARDIFQDFTQTFLMSEAFINSKFKGDPKKLRACKENLDRLGKYQVEGSLEPNNATYANFVAALRRLKRKILAERSKFQDKEEIQIVLAFTSHGNKEKDRSSGSFIFKDKSVPFNEVAAEIFQNLMHHEERGPNGRFVNVKLADEVMIFMDNCFSGNFNDQLQNFLNQKGYGSVNTIPSEQSRVISFTSSSNEQMSPGAVGAGYQAGVLMSALKETLNSYAADFNKDGILSISEFAKFVVEYAAPRHGEESEQKLEVNAASLVCGDTTTRTRVIQEIKRNSKYYNSLWNNTLQTLKRGGDSKSGNLPAANILTPKFYSNLSQKLNSSLAIALTKAGNHQTPQGIQDHQNRIAQGKYFETSLVQLAKMQQKAFNVLQTKGQKYLSESGNSNPQSNVQNQQGPTNDMRNREQVDFSNSQHQQGTQGANGFGTLISAEDLGLTTDEQKMIYGRLKSLCQNLSQMGQGQTQGNGANSFGQGPMHSGQGNTDQNFGNSDFGGQGGPNGFSSEESESPQQQGFNQ